MKLLEDQLRSWRPRRPSATLKWRLFSAPSRNSTARFLGWLTPAAACAWLAVLNLGSGNGIHSTGRHAPMIAMISSNPICVSYWPGFAQRGENAPVPAIFRWTNTGSSTFTIGLAPFPKNN
jgi:hypothetical protein